MNRKWLFAGALGAVMVLGASAPVLADDYCARPYSRQNVYVDRGYSHETDGYGYAREYNSYDDGGYSHEGNYSRQYARPGYRGYPQSQYRFSRPYDQDGYGREGYGATVHEDHIRTTFKPFPFPHIDKRVVHHEHPVY